MNKCRHCGVFVPIEKAFCPNCSEPIEPEEAPNRAASASSDMMATMRDDPESYKELLQALKKKSPAPAASEAQTPEADATDAASPPTMPQQNVGYNVPQIADRLPPAKSSKRGVVYVIGTVSFLILLFVILMVFKVF